MSVGGTVYNANDNGNIRYLQTPNSVEEGRDTKMRVNYEEEVAPYASSSVGDTQKEQRVKSRETHQTVQNGESLTASTLSQFTHTLKKRKLHTP